MKSPVGEVDSLWKGTQMLLLLKIQKLLCRSHCICIWVGGSESCRKMWKETRKVVCLTSSSVSICASIISVCVVVRALVISFRNMQRAKINASLWWHCSPLTGRKLWVKYCGRTWRQESGLGHSRLYIKLWRQPVMKNKILLHKSSPELLNGTFHELYGCNV